MYGASFIHALPLYPYILYCTDYSQCQPGTATPTTTSPAPAPTGCSGTRTKFKFFGVNESGGEFGNNVIPGQLGKDYTWPSPTSIDVRCPLLCHQICLTDGCTQFFMGQGFNTFRIPFLMERVSPPSTGGLTGPFNSTYLSGLKQVRSMSYGVSVAYRQYICPDCELHHGQGWIRCCRS